MRRLLWIILILSTSKMMYSQYSYWGRQTDSAKIHMEPRIQLTTRIDNVKVSYDGKYALTWDEMYSSRVSLWETHSGKVVRTFDVVSTDGEFSEFEPYIVYLSSFNLISGGASVSKLKEIWDARTGERLGFTPANSYVGSKKIQTNPPYYAKIDKEKGAAEILSINTQQKVCELHSPAMGGNGDIILSPNGKYLLFTGEDAFIWDIENANIYAEIPSRAYFKKYDFRKMGSKRWVSGGFIDDQHIWYGGYNGKVSKWQTSGMNVGEDSYLATIIWEQYTDSVSGIRYAATNQGLQVGEKLLNIKDEYKPVYTIIDVPSENRLYGCGDAGLFYIDKADPYTLKLAQNPRDHMTCMALSPDGKHLLIGTELHGLYMREMGDKKDNFSRYSTTHPVIRSCAFLDNETFVAGTLSDMGTLEYFRIGEQKPFKVVKGHNGGVRAIRVDTPHNLLYSVSSNMEFKIWGLDTKELVATVMPLKGRDYIIWTPDGYVKSSPNAAKYIMFGQGMQLYGYEQFEWHYNRPDLIADRLGAQKEHVNRLYAAYLKRLRMLGISENQLNENNQPPTIQLITPSDHALHSTQQTIEVAMTTPSGCLQSMNVWINGTPIHDGILPIERNKQSLKLPLTLDLVPGANHVEVSCMNTNGVESLREAWDVVVTPNADLPTRWIVSIGISHYANRNYDLIYPSKDARDIVSLLSNKAGAVKVKNQIMLLEDTQVKKDIVPRIKSWLSGAKRNDEVIIYYAGHGLLDKEAEYYLSTYDMDFGHPESNGIPYSAIDQLLEEIKPLKKMMIIDACHAGEMEKEELMINSMVSRREGKVRFRGSRMSLTESMEAAKEISQLMGVTFADSRRGNGATILVSASGMEVAMESELWGNGLFTYAIRDAIGNGLADDNNDGLISTNEFINFVINRVKLLSNGMQNPVLRNINYISNITFSSGQ